MRTPLLIPLATLVLFLAGCGGSGGSHGPGNATPTSTTYKVPIDWAERTRALTGPAAASSVVVTLAGAGLRHEDVTAISERGDSAAAHTTTATSIGSVLPGAWTLTARFYTGPGGSGDVVGTASAAVKVDAGGTLTNADGSPLGHIETVSRVASAQILPGQTIRIGATVDIVVTVRAQDNSVIAVPLNAITYTVDSPENHIVVQGGQLHGAAFGVASVRATVEGITSDPADVKVVLAPATAVTLDANDVTGFDYSPQQDKIYISESAPAQIAALDPATAMRGNAVAVGSNPVSPRVSRDGTTLYTVTTDGTMTQRIALPGLAAAGLTEIGFPVEIVPRPLGINLAISIDPNDVLVATYNGNVNNTFDLQRSGVLTTRYTSQQGRNTGLAFDGSGHVLFALSDTGMQRLEYNANMEFTDVKAFYEGYGVGRIAILDNRVFCPNGKVLDLSTGAHVASLSFGDQTFVSVAFDTAHNRAYGLTEGRLQVVSFDLTTYARIADTTIEGGFQDPIEMISAGNRRLAIRNAAGIKVVTLPEGM